jgi:sulfide:quinone oxidoreductase
VTKHVVICGAGFGGLELATRLSSELADEVRVTLLDKNDSFIFGFSKFEVLFGRKTIDDIRLYYREIVKENVDFRQELITSIDPQARRVVTESDTYDADILVVALGADYDPGATPGLLEGGYEFYSVAGAERARDVISSFDSGQVVVAILGAPFKCPPAPFECALLLHDHFVERGVRDAIDIQLISPLESPIPVSKGTSEAIVGALDERGIRSTFGELVTELAPSSTTAKLRSGGTIDYDLFLAIPVHRAPAVVEASGMLVDGWIPVDQTNLLTSFPDVYALGDVASAPVPRAGVFAETASRAVADHITARLHGTEFTAPYDGTGECYIEFGGGLVGKVDANFLGEAKPRAELVGPSLELAEEKRRFASTRYQRWFTG